MRQINLYDKGDRVYIEYEVESRFYKNDEMYYKLKEPINGTYLENAYTADEVKPVKGESKKNGELGISVRSNAGKSTGRKGEQV